MAAIRPATPEDASAIAHVHVSSWRSTYAGIVDPNYLDALDPVARKAQWAEWLTRDIPVFVAEQHGTVVGFASGGPIREPQPGFDAELYAIYLLAGSRQQGLGTSLLRSLAAHLVACEHTALLAWVLAANASRHFYERTGAHLVASQQLEIGGESHLVQAFGWPTLSALAAL